MHGKVTLATSVRADESIATTTQNERAHVRALFGNSEPKG